ncbi:MAG: cytochrome P450 [Gemmatimonadota bacterium]
MTARFPPGPPRGFPGQQLIAMRRNPLAYLPRIAREYGDLVHLRFGKQDIYLVNDPEAIRDILVTNNRQFKKGKGLEGAKKLLGEGLLTSEGSFHLRQRRLAQPAFHRERVAGYVDVMVDCAERTSARWKVGDEVDMAHEMSRLTLTIVGKTLFGAEVEEEAEEIGEAIASAFVLFNHMWFPYADLIERLPFGPGRRFRNSRARLDQTIYRMIAGHRAGGTDRGDLLSMLIMARDEEDQGAMMSDEQIRDEAITIFLAGHETTALALTWTWYLLAQHPEVETRLRAELTGVLNGRRPTMSDWPSLPYTEMVLAESMRCYPPVWILGRRALTDYPIGKYTIARGSILLMSQYVTGHDERWYPEPDRFDPDRWTPEGRASRPKFSYFPFGGGTRVCIGETFAWIEAGLVLATLMQTWRPGLVADQTVVPRPSITLRPRDGIRMVLERVS